MNLSRKLFAEFLGTAFLLAIVVGSGIMGEKLSDGNAAIALLANSIATGAGLIFLIYGFADISGAHFNSIVTLTETFQGNLTWKQCIFYISAQLCGAFFGVAIANLMFDLPLFFLSTKIRQGNNQFLSEFVATFGLIMVIRLSVKFRENLVALLVACYIIAAYWFTSSTSFANPAVTLARSVSNTFAGINPQSVPMFILAQVLGAFAATFAFNWLLKTRKSQIDMKKVLILCTGNSARSQMAEGLLKHITNNRYVINSAGTMPSIVRPEAIKALSEIGIDISDNRSKSVNEFANEEIDFVLTVCDNAQENCPYFPAKTKLIHHSFEDPAEIKGDEEIRLASFRKVRDQIKQYFENDFVKIIEKE